jgi:hypothetical protein
VFSSTPLVGAQLFYFARRFGEMAEHERQPEVKYPWQQFVLDAFMELRSENMAARINAAERAISARLCDPDAPDVEESTAIRDALRSLRVLFPEAGRPEVKRAGENSSGTKQIA